MYWVHTLIRFSCEFTMSTSTSPSTTSLYMKQRMHKLKIYGVSDLMQHIDTFKETMGDSVTVKIDDFNNLSILLCSLPPLLTALTCNMEKVDASLRFPHERWPEVISMKPRAFLYHNFVVIPSLFYYSFGIKFWFYIYFIW